MYSFRNLCRKLPAFSLFCLLLVCLFALVLFPARYAESVRQGISIWAVSVLPATFPMLFLTALLPSLAPFPKFMKKPASFLAKLFRIPQDGGAIFFLSALSGYPVGAKLLASRYETAPIEKRQIFTLACLCTTSGPAFFMGVVGGALFQSARAGLILLTSHLFGVTFVCFCMRGREKPRHAPSLLRFSAPLSQLVQSSVLSVLCVGGLIALFTLFGQIAKDIGLFALFQPLPYGEALAQGLLEMTTGCVALSNTPTPLAIALACFIVTFGGLCVLTQQLTYLCKLNVKPLPFLFVKFLQALVAGTVALLLALF